MIPHTIPNRSWTNRGKLDVLKDNAIDSSDIPELSKAFFKYAALGFPET